VRILYSNQWDLYSLTESQEDASYPVENTQDIRLAKVWRTETANAASIVIDGGGENLEVFQATENLVSDPEDLTTANWTKINCTAALGNIYYDGKRFTEITLTDDGGYITQSIVFTNNTVKGMTVTVRRGNGTNTEILLRDHDDGLAVKLNLSINWDTRVITESTGVVVIADWKDEYIVQITAYSLAVIATNDNKIWFRGASNGDWFHVTAVQLENLPYGTVYTSTNRAANHPDETFEMPSKFTIDMIVKSWFRFDTGSEKRYLSFYIDATHRFFIRYSHDNDKISMYWIDGTNIRSIHSQQFDEGTNYTNINQKIRIIASVDLTTGTTAGSRLIVEPLESGAINEETEWSGAIDAHSSTFSTLSIGHENDDLQADSQFEYIRIYAGTLVGTVGDSDDADALLAEKELILEKEYLVKITVDSAAILNHNLSADATIKIQGNDYDSWNGPPLDETMTWRADTIVTFITEASYPFWRFSITDPNVSDGYFEVGRFFLGTYLQVDPASLVEWPETHVRNDQVMFSKSNQLYGDEGVGWKELHYKFPRSTDGMKESIETMWGSCGKFVPLIFLNYDDTFTEVPPLYCVIREDIVFEHLANDFWKFDLSLREVR